MLNQWTMHTPVPVEFGVGCISKMPKHLSGCGKVLVVNGLHRTPAAGIADQVCAALSQAGIGSMLCNEIVSEPKAGQIATVSQAARSAGVDAVVGLGGGSAMDAAKAIAVGATHDGPIIEYQVGGPRVITKATLPIIAVPTTSGTGSHVGRVAVITDEAHSKKRPLGSDYLYPRAAFCDPEILRHMPPEITATTGFDAFAQALEGYLSAIENPMGNLCAGEAIRIISRVLPEVFRNGDNLKLRAQMAWADTLQGISLATQGVLIPHVIGMVLGGRYGIGHGRAVACTMGACLRHSRKGATAKLANVARWMGCAEQRSDDQLADWAIQTVEKLIADLGIARSPLEYGVPEKDFESIGEEVIAGFSYRVNADPVPTDATGIAAILRKACGR